MSERVICAECGREVAGRVPKGGDGSLVLPRYHKANGLKCDGCYREGLTPGARPTGSET